ncbi:class I SAM-dependent methyltransferase [Rhizobium sp. KVB221]|uniref:Class I SAM-dependent methyltransferase n=1 Tax=Rhizobium setariae TaxID=2801340 RepID=A0A936YJ53_9HYPH|nr:class I SAM-dependent methyltransferase [Rhizobium setariae]MBL0371113.1 class I SAM-dependent methyltransferase [Rhizobium setariae]
MSDDPLYRDPELVDFYDLENGVWDDFGFCIELARDARSLLDLGCGTGQLAAMSADGQRRVAGVDPAAAMLEVARKRDGGDKVRWVEAPAETVRLGEKFDLIMLTGHAFQVFLTDEAISAVLTTIAAHLEPEGRFIFDTRNPLCQEWREWVPDTSQRIVPHPVYGDVKAWNDVAFDDATAIATYQTFYEIAATGKTLSASSQIRFMGKPRLEALLAEAGLRADRWLGDWKGEPFHEQAKEIIPIGRLG